LIAGALDALRREHWLCRTTLHPPRPRWALDGWLIMLASFVPETVKKILVMLARRLEAALPVHNLRLSQSRIGQRKVPSRQGRYHSNVYIYLHHRRGPLVLCIKAITVKIPARNTTLYSSWLTTIGSRMREQLDSGANLNIRIFCC
jgi:hypothetical protein